MKTLILSCFIACTLFIFAPGTLLAQSQIPDSFRDPTVDGEGVITSGGFVPCSGITCSLCDFSVMANTIIKWLFGIAFLFFAVLAFKAGIGLVTSGGNPGARSAAKSSFTNAFIGLFIFLAAWLIVDTIMHELVKNNGDIEGYGPWQEVKCSSQALSDTQSGMFAGDPEYEAAPPSAQDFVVPSGLSSTPTGASGMNVQAAVSHLVANAGGRSQSLCLRYVSEAIHAGLPAFATRGVTYAKDAGPKLLQNGFTAVYSGTYSYPATDNAFQAQPGDVAIFQPGCTSSQAGHAAMYSGRIWISDFRQAEMGPNKRGRCAVTIYRP